jgi:hypothetical protein
MKGLLRVQDAALQQLSVVVEHNRRQEARLHPTRCLLMGAARCLRGWPGIDQRSCRALRCRKRHAPDRPQGRLRRRRRIAIVGLMRSHGLTVLAAMAVAAVYAYAHLPRAYIPYGDLDRLRWLQRVAARTAKKYPASLGDAEDTADRKSSPQSPGTITTRPSSGGAGSASVLSPTGP